MCGIFGLAACGGVSLKRASEAIKRFCLLSESRGKDASGLVFQDDSSIHVVKRPVRARVLLDSPESIPLTQKIDHAARQNQPFFVMGHTRMVTNGDSDNHENNQPVVKEGLVCIHTPLVNGLVALAAAGLYVVKGAYCWAAKRVGASARPPVGAGLSADSGRLLLFSEGRRYWSTFKPAVQALLKRGQPFAYYSMDIHDPGLTIPLHRQRCASLREDKRPGSGRAAGYVAKHRHPRIPPRSASLVHVFHAVMELAWYRKGSLWSISQRCLKAGRSLLLFPPFSKT